MDMKSNAGIAEDFRQIADLLEIQGDNPFRIRAYRRAARAIETMPEALSDYVHRGDELSALPTIGVDLADKIHETLEKGHCALLLQLQNQIPASLIELLRLPGIGPKRVKALYEQLNIRTARQLNAAAREGKISALPGFGEKLELAILHSLETRSGHPERMILSLAHEWADKLTRHMHKAPGVKKVMVAGSYRRCRETVGDIDLLVSAAHSEPVMAHFRDFPDIADVMSMGSTRATTLLNNKLQVDLRVVREQSFGAALVYLTGSKAHNIALRRRANKADLKLNEYGVYKGEKCIAGSTEKSVYRALGLPFIAPELRENSGEIEAATNGTLPNLLTMPDIIGELHSHSDASDGYDSVLAMAEAAVQHGMQYLAITEHSAQFRVSLGRDASALELHLAKIDQLNDQLPNITLLKGIEVDILENGQLDLPDEILAERDVVVAAVNSHFSLSEKRQTKRVLRALDNPHVNILAHPSGRLLNERPAVKVDMGQIIRQASKCGCFLELNAQPKCLDLLAQQCRQAKQEGVLVAISTDAHRSGDFDYLHYGVSQARRGWLEKADVLNTRSLSTLRRLLNRRR